MTETDNNLELQTFLPRFVCGRFLLLDSPDSFLFVYYDRSKFSPPLTNILVGHKCTPDKAHGIYKRLGMGGMKVMMKAAAPSDKNNTQKD